MREWVGIVTDDLDAIAARYYDDPPADEWIEARVQAWIMPKIIGWCQGRTLEMGYGSGITTRLLTEAGVEVEVLEGSHLLRAKAMEAGATCWHAQFEDFGPGPTYDTVLCLHVLEHVEDPVAVLRRVRGWLKPGGRLIAVTPNAQSLHREVGAIMTGDSCAALSDRDHLVGHRRVYFPDDLRADVERAGFRVRRSDVFGWFTKPVNNARMVDWPPELIDALCQHGWNGMPGDCANVGLLAESV